MLAGNPAFAQQEPVESSTLAAPEAVESGDLTPLGPVDPGAVIAPQTPRPAAAAPAIPAPALAPGLWQGIAAPDATQLIAKTELPLRSPALAGLWRRLMLSDELPTGADPKAFAAARLDGLARAGRLSDAAHVIARLPAKGADPYALVTAARVMLALGDDDKACGRVRTLPISGGPLKGRARNDALLMVAFCASRDKQPNHASLAAEVLRDQNFAEPLALAVLDSIANSKTPKLPRADNLRVIDYKLLSLLGNVPVERVLPRAPAEVLVTIARDAAAKPDMRLLAAEAAVRLGAIDDVELATAYRAIPAEGALPVAAETSLGAAVNRARLFQMAETAGAPSERAAAVRTLLDAARREALLLPVARLVAPMVATLRPTPDLASFAEPAIETLLAAGKYNEALGWALSPGSAGPTGNPLMHWLALIDIADAEENVPHGSSLKHAEDLAASGALSPTMLQRLATVLSALGHEVPGPIAQGAATATQATSQSASKGDQGRPVPEGVLARLHAAAGQKQPGATILAALAAMGPGPATTASPAALGESIKALKMAGFEAEARRLAFEAVFEAWPRRATMAAPLAP